MDLTGEPAEISKECDDGNTSSTVPSVRTEKATDHPQFPRSRAPSAKVQGQEPPGATVWTPSPRRQIPDRRVYRVPVRQAAPNLTSPNDRRRQICRPDASLSAGQRTMPTATDPHVAQEVAHTAVRNAALSYYGLRGDSLEMQ